MDVTKQSLEHHSFEIDQCFQPVHEARSILVPLHNRRLRAGSRQAGNDHHLLGLRRRTNKRPKVRYWRKRTFNDLAGDDGFVRKSVNGRSVAMGTKCQVHAFASISPIFWWSMLIAFKGRTITLKWVICPASFQVIMSTPLILMPSMTFSNSRMALSALRHSPT